MTGENEVMCSIGISVVNRIDNAMVAARDNAIELLNIQLASVGEDTKKDRHIADMYRNEVQELTELIDAVKGFRPF